MRSFVSASSPDHGVVSLCQRCVAFVARWHSVVWTRHCLSDCGHWPVPAFQLLCPGVAVNTMGKCLRGLFPVLGMSPGAELLCRGSEPQGSPAPTGDEAALG